MIDIDGASFHVTHKAFLQEWNREDYGPFTGFDHMPFYEGELRWKYKILEQRRKIVAFSKWKDLIRKPGVITKQLIKICEASKADILSPAGRFGEKNCSHAALYKVMDQPQPIQQELELCFLNLHKTIQDRKNEKTDELADIGRQFDGLCAFLKENKLGCKWDFLSFVLFIMDHETFFPIKPAGFQKALQYWGIEVTLVGQVHWENYYRIIETIRALKDKLSNYGYGEATTIQLQSYIYQTYLLLNNIDDTSVVTEDIDAELERRANRKNQLENNRKGVLGEEYVREFERKRLISAGYPKLAEKINWIAFGPDCDDSKGYDILSYNLDGSEKHIEVKTTSAKHSPKDRFWISANEVAVAKEDNTWELWRVWDIDGTPRHENLGNIVQSPPKDWERLPTDWIVKRV